jgi:hypothetical protein
MRIDASPALRLPQETLDYKRVRDQLLADYPGLDDETLQDTLEGLSDLPEIIAELIRSALIDEAFANGLSSRVSEMKDRLERLEERAKRKRQLALRAMVDADIKKVSQADFTASVRTGVPTLEIGAEEKIPAAYWKPQPPKLDKQGVIAALKSGAEVDGARLLPPQQQLSVRTK